ncbi:MAG: DUF983 domain-containing protein [Rhizobiales bacterium]|nr:DUF983 domain-containing protein [Hyphomicrobiales bacterium]
MRPENLKTAREEQSGVGETPTACSGVTIGQAVLRGVLGRCPCCGKGRMFRAFLKIADRCSACGEELHHHRADDFPAYLVIVMVGHIVVPMVYSVETQFRPPEWVHLALWLPLTLGLALALIQPVKGAVVALQWAMGMHGFEPARKARELAARRVVPPSYRATT